ncbi:MAG: HPr(Ser) kinase/phosphatase [Clostridia bacterium]|nr:HPr(Ser) kinase/phosphatase [Clostridia bacterium]
MISEKKLVKALNFEVIVPSRDGMLPIHEADVNRPGLQLTGFWDFFAYERPQLFGKVEMAYMETLDHDTLQARLNTYFGFQLPCIIICRSMDIPEAMLECARKRHIPVYRTKVNTVHLEMTLINYLRTELAPHKTMHGVLVDVYGVGMLITGNSGVGKSEAALELVKRGHRLVADDVVDVCRVTDTRLTGTAPERTRHFMEIRGVGIIDIYTMYGVSSVIREKSIDMQVHMELWQEGHAYDRLGLDNLTANILGVDIPYLLLPIHPGRNIAIVLEVAARNLRLKQMGYSAAEEVLRRQTGIMTRAYGMPENDEESAENGGEE